MYLLRNAMNPISHSGKLHKQEGKREKKEESKGNEKEERKKGKDEEESQSIATRLREKKGNQLRRG